MPLYNVVYQILGRAYVGTIHADFNRIIPELVNLHDVHISQIKILVVTLVRWNDI